MCALGSDHLESPLQAEGELRVQVCTEWDAVFAGKGNGEAPFWLGFISCSPAVSHDYPKESKS